MTGTTRSALRFRNLDVSPDDAVQAWPFEGVLAALERGTLPDWRRLIAAIDADPWGTVARAVEEAQQLELPYGVASLFAEAIAEAGTVSTARSCACVGAGARSSPQPVHGQVARVEPARQASPA